MKQKNRNKMKRRLLFTWTVIEQILIACFLICFFGAACSLSFIWAAVFLCIPALYMKVVDTESHFRFQEAYMRAWHLHVMKNRFEDCI